MKTDKQFISEIYEKFDEYTKENQKNKKQKIRKIMNMVAVIIVVMSSIIVFSGNNIEQTTVKDEKVEEIKSSLKTVENFENFYKIVKEKYEINEKTEIKGQNSVIQESLDSRKSTTNVQVENVDEADIVKVDDKYIYYVSEKNIVIVDAQNPENSEKIAEISYKDQKFSPREIYINDKKLIVIGSEYNDIVRTENIQITEEKQSNVQDKTINNEMRNKTGVIIYDLTEITKPTEIRRVMVEGTYISSRKIENDIYFVADKYINTLNIINEKVEDLKEYENQYKPTYIDTAISQEENYIEFNKIYSLEENNETNYLILVGLNIENNEDAEICTFLGGGQYIYASEKNMYIATNKITYGENYEFLDGKTHLIKFELNNGKFIFKAETDIDGQINNQFSMDEDGDKFRIATTIGSLWNIDKTISNNLYILNEKLEEIGKLEEFAKEEKIYSVRYVKDKAYVVTFKQVDPLLVIDLSDPSNPQIQGELKIPGYSTYLHPYDEKHIIGFGVDTKETSSGVTNNGLKMVMFDISDLSNPKELFKTEIKNSKYAYSELLYNHKALLFSKEKNIIAFPINSFNGTKTNSRIAIYNIDLEKGFELKGEIGNITNNYKEYVERIVYINNTYYILSKSIIKVVNMDTLEIIKEIQI